MASVNCLFLLLITQTTTAQTNGISLPMTSFSCKSSPTDQKTLTLSFTPNDEFSVPYTAVDTRPIELPKACSESLTENILQPHSLAVKVPLSVVVPASPNLDMYQKENTVVSLQTQCPTVAMKTTNEPIKMTYPNVIYAPQISPSLQSNLDKNVVFDDFIKNRPKAVTAPSYFIVNKDTTSGTNKIPVTPVDMDSIPSNVYKIKINDAKPIFIDCSKTTSHTIPPMPLTEINVKSIESIVAPEKPLIVNLLNSSPLISKTDNCYGPQTSSLSKMEENLSEFSISNMAILKPQNSNNVVYPMIFNYGSNIINPNNIQNYCPNYVTKTDPVDDEIGLSLTPTVNFVPPASQCTPYDIKSLDYENNNNGRLPSISTYYSHQSPATSVINNQGFISIQEPIVPIADLQNGNANSHILPDLSLAPPISLLPMPTVSASPKIVPSLVASSLPDCQKASPTSTDNFISSLSCSLSSIISTLTTDILTKLLGEATTLHNTNSTFEPLDVFPSEHFKIVDLDDFIDIKAPIEICNYLSNSDVLPYSPNEPFGSNVYPSTVLPQTLSCSDFEINSPLASNMKKSSGSKPYLSSVTVNIIPNESSNDIIIVI